MVRLPTRGALIVSCVLVAGCGGPQPKLAPALGVAPPHGGMLLRLPDDRGFVELISETGSTKRTAKTQPNQIIAYFLKPDGTTPLEPAPSKATFTPNSPDGTPSKPIELAAPTSEPSKTGRFESGFGPYGGGHDLDGELSATINGQEIKLSVLAR